MISFSHREVGRKRVASDAAKRGSTQRCARRGGFTLIEVLATLMLMAIVLPVLMQGATLSSRLADDARRRTEAAGLAESKLAEIVATNEWQQTNLSGDFGTDWPGYRWTATVQPWPEDTTNAGIQEIDLQVFWSERGREYSMQVSTLAFTQVQE
jgi:general secretion pathway protein I